MSERTLIISAEHVKPALENYLFSMRLIDTDEHVERYSWDIEDLTQLKIKVRKEVIN